jgi:hypothetical protein
MGTSRSTTGSRAGRTSTYSVTANRCPAATTTRRVPNQVGGALT